MQPVADILAQELGPGARNETGFGFGRRKMSVKVSTHQTQALSASPPVTFPREGSLSYSASRFP